ncbi:MAG: hypothetical protein IKC71_04225 [Clostridia bacterium]|nr:hypothetical protein [Clostridia bacterium]
MEELVNHFILAYDNAKELILGIGETLENYYKTQGHDFSAQTFCSQFDCIMQYSLLELAAADGNVNENELLLIKGTPQHGDLIDYINSFYQTKFTWENVYYAGAGVLRSWLENNRQHMDRLAHEFINGFVTMDYSVDLDLETILCEKVAAISVILSHADGASTTNEAKAVPSTYISMVLATIRQTIQNLK